TRVPIQPVAVIILNPLEAIQRVAATILRLQEAATLAQLEALEEAVEDQVAEAAVADAQAVDVADAVKIIHQNIFYKFFSMKRIQFFIIAAFSFAVTQAQNTTDGLRYSNEQNIGTARFT